MTAALEGGEWSAAGPGRTLPPGKNRYPFYRRLGGSQGRSGRTENLVPTGIRSRTVQPVVSRYTDWATEPIFTCIASDIILMRRRLCVHIGVHIFSPFLTALKVTGRQANLSSSTSSRPSVNLLCHKISLFIVCLLNTTNELSVAVFITRNMMRTWSTVISETN